MIDNEKNIYESLEKINLAEEKSYENILFNIQLRHMQHPNYLSRNKRRNYHPFLSYNRVKNRSRSMYTRNPYISRPIDRSYAWKASQGSRKN